MANDLNSVVLVGNLTKDVVVEYTPSGAAVGKMSIAVNRSVKRGDQWTSEASFFDLIIFGKTVENLKQYLTKGKKIGVAGYLKQDRWEKDGEKRSRVSVVVDNLQLLGAGNNEGNNGNCQPQSGIPQYQNSGHEQQYEDDIPFN